MSTTPNRNDPVPGRSFLYECRVLHHRRRPRDHRFSYGLFLLSLDLDELPTLGRRLRLLGRNRRNLYEFRDRDHLEHPATGGEPDLKSSIRSWLATQGIATESDVRIQLVTLPRVAGYVFNPVSFYFVTTPEGVPVCAVVEVGNTFGELKAYVVPPDGAPHRESTSARYHRVVPKEFYVSPFSDLDVRFDFNLKAPGDRLEIVINDVTADGTVLLVSVLTGRQHPLTDLQLLRLTAKYPLVTLRVISLIHWEAFRLWAKRLPWHRKAENPALQTGVHRPHASLRSASATLPIPSHSPTPP
ncbi:MAG: DUF1365 domain-containing protein [Verrucomicrobiales bacterium]|nr:DUF1365 domain-containing protein [Verrucomicrobiales bacterium]